MSKLRSSTVNSYMHSCSACTCRLHSRELGRLGAGYLLRGALGMHTGRKEKKKVESGREETECYTVLCAAKTLCNSMGGSKTGNCKALLNGHKVQPFCSFLLPGSTQLWSSSQVPVKQASQKLWWEAVCPWWQIWVEYQAAKMLERRVSNTHLSSGVLESKSMVPAPAWCPVKVFILHHCTAGRGQSRANGVWLLLITIFMNLGVKFSKRELLGEDIHTILEFRYRNKGRQQESCLSPTAWVCVVIHDLCYHWRPFECLWSVLSSEVMLMSMGKGATRGHIDAGGLYATGAYGDIWVLTEAQG